jgi:hypothetical protein
MSPPALRLDRHLLFALAIARSTGSRWVSANSRRRRTLAR